jgi:CubicO group peptidase (beta-lactamase class C family)
MRRGLRLVVVAGLAGAAGSAHGGDAPRAFAAGSIPTPRFADPDRLKKLEAAFPHVDRAFRDYQERAKWPAVAWGVVVDGVLVHHGALGVREVSSGAPADRDTAFRIASMTKSFTALAILRLRDEGRLALEDPVGRYVPELRALPHPTRDSPEVTIRHLLTHSAGFPEDNPWGDRQLAVSEATLSDWMRGGIPFSSAPGVAFEYSNYGFAILGQVVARVSGMRYRDYVDRHILQPLGLTSTKWEAAAVPADRLAHGYRREDDRFVEEEPLPDGAFGAIGGLYSSVTDLARYVSFFLSAWPPRDDEDGGPVRRSSVREMQQAARAYRATAYRTSVDAPLQLSAGGYGYGLGATQSCRFRTSVSHSGGLPGYGSQMRWLPEHGVGIVALTNLTYGSPARAVAEALEAMARTGALQPREAQPSAALVAAREGVDRLLSAWDDLLYESLAASNLSLDRPQARRKKELEALRVAHGTCRPEGPIDAENALRGEWWLACDRGRVRVSLTLAPTAPPRVQHLETVSVLPLSPGLEAAAATLTARVSTSGPVQDLLASGIDPTPIARALAAASAWGGCRVGTTRAGGGDRATLRLVCDKGELEARLEASPTGGLTSMSLAPAGDDSCVP